MIEIAVNGETKSTQAETVAALFAELELQHGRVAVAVNGQVVVGGDYENQQIKNGDEIVIVHAVGGG